MSLESLKLRLASDRRTAWVMLVVLGLVWGSFFIEVKRTLIGIPPLEGAGLRTVMVAVLLSPLVFKALAALNRRNVWAMLYLSLVGNSIPLILYPVAQSHITSALAGIINALTPLCTLLISWAFFSMRTTGSMWLGMVVGFGGAVVLFAGKSSGLEGEVLYAGMALLCAASNGINSNIMSRYLKGVPAPYVACLMFFFVSIPAFAALAYGGTFTEIVQGNFDHEAMLWMALLALTTAAAVMLFNIMIAQYGPVFASTTTYLLPAVAILWGVLDGETVGIRELCGVALILSGIYLTNRRISLANSKKPSPHPSTRD